MLNTKLVALDLRGKVYGKKIKAGCSQPDKCQFCYTIGPVVYDHDHTTDIFRSWPCNMCNRAMGLVKDRPDVLRKMADCIEEHNLKYGNKIQL